MIKPDWNIFKAKFSENPQKNFEWFCYMLFCKEFHKKSGIFRYKNQSAIETDPIEVDGQFIGWQAKFYDTTLSSNKKELICTIKRAQRDYPQISKILLYSNQEWSQYKGQKTKVQTEIESVANSLNIKLEWRTASYFETSFVTIDNKTISQHFFSLDKSIFDSIQQQKVHSANILSPIQTAIAFNGQNIEIDRNNDLKSLRQASCPVTILSGVPGVGKTALLKKYYEELKDQFPFYIFKATEFEIPNINFLFTGISFQDFINAHSEEENRFVVIDSAEKLLDLKNNDPFKEFLSYLVVNKWKLIFTTRNNYLGDLTDHLSAIYRSEFINIKLRNLEEEVLSALADQYNFSLPEDIKLLDLIKNPFYLDRFLQFYRKGEKTSYTGFKENLWRHMITKTKPAREQCFLKTAFKRANEGQFFVNPDYGPEIFNELKSDGIFGYESPHGYFITHDIYEEWALEKIIECEFDRRHDTVTFLKKIGSSLPIRRSFRKWVSEKLLLEDKRIKNLIEEMIDSSKIQSFWQDELLVPVLLSNYSEQFFKLFRDELLTNKQDLLKKLCLHLRIACKEADTSIPLPAFVFPKPKGHGWNSLIRFVYHNLDRIGINNTFFMLPIIHDWNGEHKEGETTRLAALIALEYYNYMLSQECYYFSDGSDNELVYTILWGSFEIKDELQGIFDCVINNKWKKHRDPYYDLCKTILEKFGGAVHICKVLPNSVIKIADLFWTSTPKEREHDYNYRRGIEHHFGMESDQLAYFPASSVQTPTHWLLRSSLKDTVDFILTFTNKATKSFANSEFGKGVYKTDVFIDDDNTIKQYVGSRLWGIYRGATVAPRALESMHMALERYFLDVVGKQAKSEILENWLKYLLMHSDSASITAIVASVITAYPEKTFNIAKILFRTKDFFLYDTARYAHDCAAKSLCSMGYGLNVMDKIHNAERIEACDHEHRQLTLENIFLKYQLIKSNEISQEEFAARRNDLWKILDNYYEKLPNESEETENDKTWRLCLAGMDGRKMQFGKEKINGQHCITLNPDIDPSLKEYSEKPLEKINALYKYTILKLWSCHKFEKKEDYKKYEQYENSPQLALKETKAIMRQLKEIKPLDDILACENLSDEAAFYLANHSIPAYVCSVLLEDHLGELSKADKKYCKEIIYEYAQFASSPQYRYQINDGTHPSILALPTLFNEFPNERDCIKKLLLFNLFNDCPIEAGNSRFSKFAILAILKLWDNFFDDAQSLLLGYLILKQNYKSLTKRIRQENYKKHIYDWNEEKVRERFLEENKIVLKKTINNEITIDDLDNLEKFDLSVLQTAFMMIPNGSDNQDHKDMVLKIVSAFSKSLLSVQEEKNIDYTDKRYFLEKYAFFVLKTKQQDIEIYLKPFLEGFNSAEPISELFEKFITAEDYLNAYDNFWTVWHAFKDKVVELCKDGDGYRYTNEIIMSYLFADTQWKADTTSWHTLKDENKMFFKKMTEQIGHCPSALYAISKLLNTIGSNYLEDGIQWISSMLRNNQRLHTKKHETNTVYYIENISREYIYKNREQIKKEPRLKQNLVTILDFLISQESVIGYRLREDIA